MKEEVNNLWILTEERLKIDVLKKILNIYIRDKKLSDTDIANIIIKPLIEKNIFKNQYKIENFKIPYIENIYSRIVSGSTSFVDHLLFVQKDKPKDYSLKTKNFKYFVEDTKTDTKESRNTAFGQRATKTIIANYFNKSPFKLIITSSIFKYDQLPESAIFDARCLMTTGVEIFMPNTIIENKPFKDYSELINKKNSMRKPPSSNVPFRIKEVSTGLEISKKIIKGKSLSDPSVGQILNVCFALRQLNYTKKIKITSHGLNQKRFDKMQDNKLLLGCKLLKLDIDGITLSNRIVFPELYWHYPNYLNEEKHATILLHHLINYNQKDLEVIFDHHAGCARNYIKNINDKNYSVNKTPTGKTPDLIIRNKKNKTLYLVEGKTSYNLEKGIEEIKGFPDFYKKHLVKDCGYKNYKMESWITLTGDSKNKAEFQNILFTLKNDNSLKINKNLNKEFKILFNSSS